MQHIVLDDEWHLTINESYSYMFSAMTSLDNPVNTAYAVAPQYFKLQVGIMYKYFSNGWPARYDEED